MKNGQRLQQQPTLSAIRTQAAGSLEQMPEPLRCLEPGASYTVQVTERLKRLAAEVDQRLAQQEETQS
jgi:Nicotinate phosphoribosyltransferase C-terminal domain